MKCSFAFAGPVATLAPWPFTRFPSGEATTSPHPCQYPKGLAATSTDVVLSVLREGTAGGVVGRSVAQ